MYLPFLPQICVCVSVVVGVCRLTTAVKIEFRCRFNVKIRDEPSNFYTDNYDTKMKYSPRTKPSQQKNM